MSSRCQATNYIWSVLNVFVSHNLLAMQLITSMVEHLLKRQIASWTLTSAGNCHFTPSRRSLPSSSHSSATVMERSSNHGDVRSSPHDDSGCQHFCLFLCYAHLDSSKAVQLSSSGLCRTLEVCRGSKMIFWKKHGPRNQNGLGLNPDSAICWLWSLGDIVLPL